MTAPVESPDSTPDGPARRVARVIAWLGVMLIVAIAGAGLILSLDHAPTEEGRPELTAHGHGIVAPRLAAMEPDLEQLAGAGDAVAAAGRDTLTRLRALDVAGTDRALTAGDQAAADAAAARDRILAGRSSLLQGTSLSAVPISDADRIGAIDAAIAAADEVPGEWLQVSAAATGPQDLVRAMNDHDRQVIAATDSGRAGAWSAALTSLGAAQRALAPARAVREVAHAAGLDTSTLDDLLDRLDTYDQALTDLYASLRSSGGQTTDASAAALARVGSAQESLPLDQSAMVVIVSDLVGPTITPVLLSLESARRTLRAAVATQPVPGGTDQVPTGGGLGASASVSS